MSAHIATKIQKTPGGALPIVPKENLMAVMAVARRRICWKSRWCLKVSRSARRSWNSTAAWAAAKPSAKPGCRF
jgi:hypothetical protein